MRATTTLAATPVLLLLVLALLLMSGCSRHSAADKRTATVPADSGKTNAVVSPALPPAPPSPPAMPGNVTLDNADGVAAGAMSSPWRLGLGQVDEVTDALPPPLEPVVAASPLPKNVTVDNADSVTASAMTAPSQGFAGSGSASPLSVLVQDGSGSIGAALEPPGDALAGSTVEVPLLVQDGSAFIGATLELEAPLASSTAGVPPMVSIEHGAGVLGRGLVRQDDLEGRAGSAAPMVLVEHASGALGSPMGAVPAPG